MVDLNEYERIVKKYRKPLFKYCYYRLNGNIDLTEETIDDILHVLWRKWHTLDINGNVRAWLYRVADKEILRHLKNYNRYYKHNESLEAAIEDRRIDHLEYRDIYFAGNDISEDEYMEKICDSLSEEYKLIFRCRYIEQKTLMETSTLLEIPYSSLRLRISKLEVMVRKKVEELFNK